MFLKRFAIELRGAHGLGRALWATMLLATGMAHAQDLPGNSTTPGEQIYRHGVLPSGRPLIGRRAGLEPARGASVACVNCHRRSGLGSAEGKTTIPPAAQADWLNSRSDLLAGSIREGTGADGRPLDFLMPRFELSDGDLAVLGGYLRTLGTTADPSRVPDILQVATVITPGVSAARRDAMLAVLREFVATQNLGPRRYFDGKYLGEHLARCDLGVAKYESWRKWNLHVWELNGPPQTWPRQLAELMAAEPVFALISGMGDANWLAVQQFCEAHRMPCVAPNIEAAPDTDGEFYSVYFSRGVVLEAALMNHEIIAKQATSGLRRVVQVFRSGGSGEVGAHALAGLTDNSRLQLVERPVPAAAKAQGLEAALRGVGAGDILVLWLKPEDLASLPGQPRPYGLVLSSGLMGGLESSPVPQAWRSVLQMTYPFDLPGNRAGRMNVPLSWFALHHLSVTNEQIQADTYLACVIFSQALEHMRSGFSGEYLIEQLEDLLGNRTANGYYPTLSLAPGQRVASRGGYVVHFAEPAGTVLVSDAQWLIP